MCLWGWREKKGRSKKQMEADGKRQLPQILQPSKGKENPLITHVQDAHVGFPPSTGHPTPYSYLLSHDQNLQYSLASKYKIFWTNIKQKQSRLQYSTSTVSSGVFIIFRTALNSLSIYSPRKVKYHRKKHTGS